MGTFSTSPSPLSAGAPSPIGGPIKSGPILLPTIYILRNPRNSSSLILLPTSRHPLTRQPSALQSASPIPLRPFLSRTGAARPHSADSAVRTGTAPPPHAASQPRTRRALHSTPVLGFHRPHATRTRSTPPPDVQSPDHGTRSRTLAESSSSSQGWRPDPALPAGEDLPPSVLTIVDCSALCVY